MAKMHLVPIRRGYWGKNSGLPHTVKKSASKTGAICSHFFCSQLLTFFLLTIFHTDSDEALRDLWQRERPLNPGAARHGPRRRSGLEEDPGHGWPRGLLLHDARPLAHDGQLHHGGLQRGLGLVRLPLARALEADGLQQGSVPRTHRLPRQGGRIGQGRRSLLGSRHEYRRRPGRIRSPATSGAYDPRGVSRTGLARKWSNNQKNLLGKVGRTRTITRRGPSRAGTSLYLRVSLSSAAFCTRSCPAASVANTSP